jgi:hypothetical protein
MGTPNAKLLGKHLVVVWTPTVGSPITLNTYSRNFQVKQVAKEIDTTTREDVLDDAEDNEPGVPSREITVSGLDSDENAPDWETIDIGDEGTLDWYRRGNTSGKPKKSISARCMESNFGSPHDNANDWEVKFKGLSAITPSTVP